MSSHSPSLTRRQILLGTAAGIAGFATDPLHTALAAAMPQEKTPPPDSPPPALTVGADGIPAQKDLDAYLEAMRTRHRLPAVGAALLRGGAVTRTGVAGIRKWGGTEKVTPDEPFHIGSCGKAMTATLIALLVEQGKVGWDQKLTDVLPDLKDTMQPEYRTATITHLLSHRSGLPGESFPGEGGGLRWFSAREPLRAQRAAYARAALAQKPIAAPGEKFLYSNAGYTLAGHIAERVAGPDAVFETLLQERLFTPLGITTAASGPQHGTDPKAPKPAPWPHKIGPDKTPSPVAPGRGADNPPVLSPAGTFHMSITDWAKFCALHISAEPTLLKPETLRTLHKAPVEGADYGMGWVLLSRPWAGSRPALMHNGSNTMNYALAWLSPEKNFGALVVTNIMSEGPEVPLACDAVVTGILMGLIQHKPA